MINLHSDSVTIEPTRCAYCHETLYNHHHWCKESCEAKAERHEIDAIHYLRELGYTVIPPTRNNVSDYTF